MLVKNIKTVKVSRSLLYSSGFVTKLESREAVWRIILRLCVKKSHSFLRALRLISPSFDELHSSGIDGAIGDLRHNSNRRVKDMTH